MVITNLVIADGLLERNKLTIVEYVTIRYGLLGIV